MAVSGAGYELERGRKSYSDAAWATACESLSRADQQAALGPEDLELLATSVYMLGREGEWMAILERAYHGYSESGEMRRAVRCAFWIGIQLALRGEMGPATGWLGRAQRLLEQEEGECVEQGYMLMPVVFQHEAQGDWEGASATAAAAAEIGERFRDADLFALAIYAQGDILVRYGRVSEGLRLLDEAMVAVTTEPLSPCCLTPRDRPIHEFMDADGNLLVLTWDDATASLKVVTADGTCTTPTTSTVTTTALP